MQVRWGSWLCLSLILSCALSAMAVAATLSPEQMDRLRVYKSAVREVDALTIQEELNRMEASGYPEQTLMMLEAMAATYGELVKEQDVLDPKQKQWLFSMVQLNMAYMKLNGRPDVPGTNTLNRIILAKLRKHLPDSYFRHPAFLE